MILCMTVTDQKEETHAVTIYSAEIKSLKLPNVKFPKQFSPSANRSVGMAW